MVAAMARFLKNRASRTIRFALKNSRDTEHFEQKAEDTNECQDQTGV